MIERHDRGPPVTGRLGIRPWLAATILVLLALPAAAHLVLAHVDLLTPSGPDPVSRLDLEASQLGIGVAQLPERRTPADVAAGPRDLHVRLFYPAVAGPKPLPILVYFPGWPSDRHDNDGLLGDLASHGYLVAGVTYTREDQKLEGPMDFSTSRSAEKTLWMANAKATLQARDASSLLDALERLNARDPVHGLANRLNPARAGVLGFSFGGAVAAQAGAHDARFRAVLNMDGWLFGEGSELSFPQPYFLMSDDDGEPTAAELVSSDAATRYPAIITAHDFQRLRLRLARPEGHFMRILRAPHESFAGSPLHYSLRHIATLGPLRAWHISSVIRRYAGAFFDTYLKDEPSDLLTSTASPYPDVTRSVPEASDRSNRS